MTTNALVDLVNSQGIYAAEQLGIKVTKHPSDKSLFLFKYDQIESSKFKYHPVVMEARGAVLHHVFDSGACDYQFYPVARPFRRFFNLGENSEQELSFDWTDFKADVKEDGSLVIAYNHNGAWHFNTSGSFGQGPVGDYASWHEYIRTASPYLSMFRADPSYTYLFELVGPTNQIVRLYKKPRLILLGARNTSNGNEMSPAELNYQAVQLNVDRPASELTHAIKDRESLENALRSLEKENPTHEGFVLRDTANNRIKCKTATYYALHHLKDNGNISRPDRLVELVLRGDVEKVLETWPDLGPDLELWRDRLNNSIKDIQTRYMEVKNIENQKDFALSIKNHPFSSVMFAARKSQKDVRAIFMSQPADKLVEKLSNG